MRVMALLACTLLLAGCTLRTGGDGGLDGGPGSGPGGRPPAEVVFAVTSAGVAPGRCFDGAEVFGDVCHVLDVQVDNSGRRNELDTNTLAWKAVDTGGRVHDFGRSDADAVAGGAVANITVSFTLEDGAPHLAKLQYHTFAGRGEAPIPHYAHGP